jgi:NADH-quinone oxidoreductase subunit G
VRFHQEIPGDEALAAVQRGPDSEIDTLPGEPYNSIFSGNTIELCPVGALTSRQYRFKARPWDLVRTPSVCNGCAVGCNVEVHSRTETVLRLVSRENPAVDDGWLCDRGRFDTVPSPQTARHARPMVRDGGNLRATTWVEALGRAAALLRDGGGVLASPALSNEALFLLEQAGASLPGALWPAGGGDWPVSGRIENLARARSIVLVGLDVWNELPVLALWIRRAVQAGGKLVVLGPLNGLWRSTAHWLRDESMTHVAALTSALEGDVSKDSDPAILAAAAAVRGAKPAVLLAHPSLVGSNRAALEGLAAALGAEGETGLVGAPLLSANGRGAQDFAPSLTSGDPLRIVTSSAVLALGDEPWAELDTGNARVVLATSSPVPDDPRVEVVLPMAHAYERQASITNLEGRVQRQEGGAAPAAHARPDWGIVGALLEHLGIAGSPDLRAIRAAIAAQRPDLGRLLTQEALIARV